MNTKKSLKGGSCIHFRPCLTKSSDIHNERKLLEQYNSNIDASLSIQNRQWINQEWQSLEEYEAAAQKDYEAQPPMERVIFNPKTKKRERGTRRRVWAKNYVAIKEGVIVNLPDGSSETFNKLLILGKLLEEKYNIKLLRVFQHSDEHRKDPETEIDKFNRHGHLVFGWYDFQNHKPYSINPDNMSIVQDIAAEILKLPRGNRTGDTGRKSLSNLEYKNGMEIIRQEKLREMRLRKEYEHHLTRLKMVYHPYLANESAERLLSVNNDDFSEIDKWEASPLHPIAYHNCVNRFSEKVEKINKIATNLEEMREKEMKKAVQYMVTEYKSVKSKRDEILKGTPSPLQFLRFVQENRDKAIEDVQGIINKQFKGEIVGMQIRKSREGKDYELIEMDNNGQIYHLEVFLSSGNIYYQSKKVARTRKTPIPELTEYLKASISPELRMVLEEALPITNEYKMRNSVRNVQNGLSQG